MENINKIQIVPDEVYEIGADKAPVIPEWSIKDDATLWQKVNKLAHSTFDRSKFTVVGSPNITDDGIASGFSDSNYLNAINNFNPQGSWEITMRIMCTDYSRACYFLGNIGYGMTFGITDGGYLKLWLSSNGSSWDIASGLMTNNAISLNAYYFIKIGFNGSEYYIDSSIDGINYNNRKSAESSLQISLDSLFVGIAFQTGYPWVGSIDLKQFSITVDGVEVFSGNKTGLDTIKPDDYTVVGTPTISADGIASGFSGSNYIITPSSFDFSKPWKISGVCSFSRIDKNQPIVKIVANNDYQRCLHYSTTGYIVFSIKLDDGINEHQLKVAFNPSINTNYAFSIEWTGSLYTLRFGNAYIAFSSSLPLIIATANRQVMLGIQLETASAATWAGLDGTIDLNAFKIYVDGNLAYQPCLKIPYTEGQNYVKVVDKLYRDRVKDLFEQKGYNGYYTIGEDDFTLPSNKWSDIVEHKENGLTVAEQRVDQTLTIRGACEQGVDVNLPMEFFSADSYAVFGVGTTGTNTASKFTPAADGNYIAIGKGKV